MRLAPAANVAVILLTYMPLAAAPHGQQGRAPGQPAAKADGKGPIKSASGQTFYLTRSVDSPTGFNLIASDGEESVISGQVTVEQLKALGEMMDEARRFAANEEAVGKGEPVTTRFSSETAKDFAVDVTKLDNESQLYITIRTDVGYITLDGGSIIRGSKKEEGFFFDILSRIQSQMPAPSRQPNN